MERLTYRDETGRALLRGYSDNLRNASNASTDRLAAYEDTGITPEEINLFVKCRADYTSLKELDLAKENDHLRAENEALLKVKKAADKMASAVTSGIAHTADTTDKVFESIDELQAEYDRLLKAFVLACRVISDFLDCPAADGGVNWTECSGELDRCGDRDTWECWQKYFRERAENELICRVCGCTQENACAGGCWWTEEDLCNRCAEMEEEIDGTDEDCED